ncbi:MAG: GNAT family N-acetyltransferase [Pseudomonadota bacterium]
MRYPKTCMLKDREDTVIRLLEPGDRQRLAAFFSELSSNDRWFMKYDVMDPGVLNKWFEGLETGAATSIVALCNERIIGHASLHKRTFGATRHVGRLRITVHPDFRKKRLGTWLLLDLIQLAMDKGLEMLRMDVVAGVEDTAIEAVARLDFFRYATLERYVKDLEGNLYDLVIMVKRLHQDWSDF